jgi:biopolymer transport protein ExbD
MRRRLRRGNHGGADELNVTPFMNLMVVLVPFLLVSAVFSEYSVHNLNLPSLVGGVSDNRGDKPKLALEVVIRSNSLDVIDANSGGRLKLIPNQVKGHDYVALNDYLLQVKASYPSVKAVTLLFESEVPYDVLISTMDSVRSHSVKQNGQIHKSELFPEVSVGDAPLKAGSGAVK